MCNQRKGGATVRTMAEILVRQAVSPDIELLAKFDHTVKTECVWQMMQSIDAGKIVTSFVENHLPREMRLTYPKSPDTLLERWKDYSSVLVACINSAPVGYITFTTSFAPYIVWIKDLVVDELWRRKSVATTLIQAVNSWGTARHYVRMSIEMSSKNYPAINFVKKCGFDFSGYDDNFFNNNDIALFFSRFIK
jgi:GNAT superfamily N-acetyltransferase